MLHDVDFAVYPGQVTALVGDNGAGKSTLVKCVAGIYALDSGEFLFEGKPVTIHGPRDAAALGIEVVYQDLALCDNLDIVQNMFLGREQTNRRRASTRPPWRPAPARRSPSLSVRTVKSVRQQRRQPLRWPAPDRGHRQGGALELQGRAARRADRRPRRGADPQVLDLVRRLADRGLGVVLISHNMIDVFEVADRITALYLGRVAADVTATETSPQPGRRADHRRPLRRPRPRAAAEQVRSEEPST